MHRHPTGEGIGRQKRFPDRRRAPGCGFTRRLEDRSRWPIGARVARAGRRIEIARRRAFDHDARSRHRDPAGKMFLTMLAAFAEFETSQMKERTTAGRIEARKRGVQFGPRPKTTPSKLTAARQLLNDPSASVSTGARALGVGRATLYRALSDRAE